MLLRRSNEDRCCGILLTSGSVLVCNTTLLTLPPPGVYVVTKVLPFASVVRTTSPDVTSDKMTVLPEESVVVISTPDFGFGWNVGTGEVVSIVWPAAFVVVFTTAGTREEVVIVFPFESVVVIEISADTDAEAMTALVVLTWTAPPASVDELSIGTTTGVFGEEAGGGGAAAEDGSLDGLRGELVGGVAWVGSVWGVEVGGGAAVKHWQTDTPEMDTELT